MRRHLPQRSKPRPEPITLQGNMALTPLQAAALLKAALVILKRHNLSFDGHEIDESAITRKDLQAIAQAASKLEFCIRD